MNPEHIPQLGLLISLDFYFLDFKTTLLKRKKPKKPQTNQSTIQVENMDRYSWYVFVAFSAVIQQNKKAYICKRIIHDRPSQWK